MMPRMLFSRAAAFLGSRPEAWRKARGFVIIAALAAALGLAARYIFAPMYMEIAGFLPFDLQFPLSRFMIGVELGTFEGAVAIKPYVLFAVVHFGYVAAVAALFTLFWRWLLTTSATRMLVFFRRGGILMIPSYVVVVDLLAKVGFFRLLGGFDWPSPGLAVDVCASIHRFKFAMVDIRNYLTIAFILVVLLDLVMRRGARRS
jgi:hypothetical protein